MKKRLLTRLTGLFIMLLSVNALFAQSVTNGGFETWVESPTYEHPVVSPAPVFSSSNSESFFYYNILTVTEVTGFSGSGMRVETKAGLNNDTLKGYASWGEGDGGQFNKGIPLPGNQPLTGLSLYLKYSCTAATPGFIAIIPLKNGLPAGAGNGLFPGAYAYQLSGTQSSFTLTNYTLTPALLQNPDSCLIFIAAANMIGDEKGTIGDYIEVDELTWLGNTNPLYGGTLDVWQELPAVEAPDEWTVDFQGTTKTFAKSTDAKFGDYSLELFNISANWGVNPGRATLGRYENCNGGPCDIVPGMKVLSTPKSFGFYYKYSTPGIDTASCYISMFKNGSQVGFGTYNYIFPSSNWKYYNVIIPDPGVTPDSVFISFESGRWQTAVVGSNLKLDGLKFHFCDDASAIEGPTTICSGTSNVQFVMNEEFASGYTWGTTTGTISGSSTNDTVTINSISGAGTISVTKSYADGCPNKLFDLNVTVTATSSSIAGSDQSLCKNNANATLSGSVTGATGGSWSSSGSGTFDDNTSLTAVYTPSLADLTAGSVALTLTPTGTGGCTVSTDELILTFTTAPTVGANIDQTLCSNNAITTLAGTKTVASGIEWTSLGSGTFSDNTSLTSTYTPSINDKQSGSVKLVITTTGNGTCNAVTDTMMITLTAAPTANAGSDATICKSANTTNLSGSVTVATGGTWSTSGTGTFTNGSTLTPTYNISAADKTAGSVTLTLTTTGHGTCTAVTDQILITLQTIPTANAGSDQGICSTTTATLSGTVTGATGNWSTSGTGTFNDATSMSAVYTPSAADKTAGSVTITLTTTGNGSCSAVTDAMTLSITAPPTVDAGSNATICANTNATLSGAKTVATGSTWTTSGTGTFANASNLSTTYTASTLDKTNGSVTLTLTTTGNGFCSAATDQVVITLEAVPTANAGSDQGICSNTTATLSGAVGSTGNWTSSGTGSFSNSTSMTAVYTPSAADKTAGTVTLTLTTTGNVACSAVSDAMTLSITAPPTVDAGSSSSICANTNATLSGSKTVATGSTWTTSGTGTFANASNLSTTYTASPLDKANGSVTLTLTTTGNGYCSAASDQVVITLQPMPTANAGSDQSICSGSFATLSGAMTGASGILWTTSGSGSFGNSTNLSTSYTPSGADVTAGTVTITLTTTGNVNCSAVSDALTLTFTSATSANAGSDISVCSGATAALNASVTGANGGAWTTSGTGTFDDATILNAEYNPSAADITAGTVTLTLTTTGNGSCASSTDDVVINIVASITVSAGSDQAICDDETAVLAGSYSGASGIQWTTSGTGTFDDNTAVNAVYTPSAADIIAGSVTLTSTSTGNGTCTGASDDLALTINVCTGTAKATLQETVSFYPNPSSSLVTIDFGQDINVESIQIVNPLQNEVQYSEINNVINKHSISLNGLDAGIYMVIIRSDKGTIVKKVIKQ